jgi:hypothetical protein
MLIGLSGYARSGKDTVAQFIIDDYGFVRRAFADKLKAALIRLNPMVDYVSPTSGKTEWFRLTDAIRYYGGLESLKSNSPELRALMQRLGTEVGRDTFGTNFWVDQALGEVFGGLDIVVTDVRFENEVDAIRNRGGVVWRISRSGVAPVNGHSSETAIDHVDFDRYISNDGTLEELHDQVTAIMDPVGSAHE